MTTTDLSPETLRQQAQALQDQAAELERQAKEQAQKKEEEERKARLEAQQNAARAKRRKILDAIIDAIKIIDKDLEVVVDDSEHLIIDGHRRWELEIEAQREKTYSRFSSGRPTGLYRVVVGDYGDKTNHPPKKDGTHNYEAIAQRLVNIHRSDLVKIKAKDNAMANEAIAKKIRDVFGYSDWSSEVQASSDPTKPLKLSLSLGGHVTEEQATEILKLHLQMRAILYGGKK